MYTVDLTGVLTEGQADLSLPPMSDAEFIEFCQRNPLLNVERNANGSLRLMPPVTAWADSRNGILFAKLYNWNESLKVPGICFGPTAGFKLPNTAIRAPDAAWMSQATWDALPKTARFPYPTLCPTFVVEIMSPSDRLAPTKRKMREYLQNGAQLGWLIQLEKHAVYVYRPDQIDPKPLINVQTLSGDPELPGFVANLAPLWEKGE